MVSVLWEEQSQRTSASVLEWDCRQSKARGVTEQVSPTSRILLRGARGVLYIPTRAVENWKTVLLIQARRAKEGGEALLPLAPRTRCVLE